MASNSATIVSDGNANEIKPKVTSETSKYCDTENYILVDIGANLTNKKFVKDLDSVIARARNAGLF